MNSNQNKLCPKHTKLGSSQDITQEFMDVVDSIPDLRIEYDNTPGQEGITFKFIESKEDKISESKNLF